MKIKPNLIRWGLAVGLLGTAVLLWFAPGNSLRQALAFALLAIWPMLTWALFCQGSWPVRMLTAGGLALLLQALMTMMLHYVPGPLPGSWLLLGLVLISLVPLARQPESLPAFPQMADKGLWYLVGGIFLLTLLLRWPNLGYKEFQGDEGIIMARAAAMLAGDDAEMLNHQKGPIEILLPLALWGSGEAITEFWSRLPFWWGGLLVVGAIIWLGERWFSLQIGLLAGLLFLINGFALAFSRIVQYQTFVMLWGMLAIIFADLFAESGHRRDLWLTAVFLAGGLLAHYDAVLVLPVILWLLWPRIKVLPQFRWRIWGIGFLLGAGIVGSFYLPFFLNPSFRRTGSYLFDARLGGSLLSWSGPEVWQMATFYNSTYYIVGLIFLIIAAVWVGNGRLGRNKGAWLYFLVPLGFYLLVVADPRTHVYTFFPGAVLLAAFGLARLDAFLTQSAANWQRLVRLSLGMFVIISAFYPYLLFVDTRLERQRSWAEARPAGYLTTFDEPPLFGLFGFPYQAGWRAVAELPLTHPIASNEEEEITDIYLGPGVRTFCPDANTFIQAARVQDSVPYDPAMLENWHLQYDVVVNGRNTMQIFSRKSVEAVQKIEVGDKILWLHPTEVAPRPAQPSYPLEIVLGEEQVRLIGYDLDTRDAYPGGEIALTLYWEAMAPFIQNYQVFSHIFLGEVLAQHDGSPECGFNPTVRWEPGEVVADLHVIPLPETMPTGEMTLLVGLYDLETLERLVQKDTDIDAIQLTNITVREAGP